MDSVEGAVRIPKSLLNDVLDYMERRKDPEVKIKESVSAGSTVEGAFTLYR